jgi:hypothetical protein
MARTPSNGRSRGKSQRGPNPAVVPSLIALALIVVAVIAAVLTRKDKQPDDAAAPKPKPFADMPPEVPPPPKQNKPGSNLPMAPDSILSEPVWIEAKALAADARTLYDAAVAARTAGDITLAAAKGSEARKKYEQAAELTAEWEESVLAQYNEYDPKVSGIKDERTDWFNKMQWLKKSVGH